MTTKTKPITPADAAGFKKSKIPDHVIAVFNELIRQKFDGTQATIKQEDVVALILNTQPLVERDAIFANHWLDVEEIFEDAGWQVEFDKPGYNESYDAFFTFRIES